MKKSISKPLIVIVGPTASGKTDLAIHLAKKCNGEVISADSRQIYRGMDIGTAKASGKWQMMWGKKVLVVNGIPHHMIDVADPDRTFTVQEYKQTAIKIIRDVQTRGKLPILAGGTGLYISAIVNNLHIPKITPDKKLREKLEKKTTEELFNELKRRDPHHAKTVDRHNRRRLIRALEVTIKSGTPFSRQQKRGKPLFRILQIGIRIQKETLSRRIEKRLEQQLKIGLLGEVRQLRKKYGCTVPAMTGITYREMCEYLVRKITLEEAIEKMKSNNKKYARRQMTWFKRDPRVNWVTTKKAAEKLVANFPK